jgi:hypothetical protein
MFRRYALPCLLIMAVSLGSAALAYLAAPSEEYHATCLFQVVVRTIRDQPPNKEYIDFTSFLATAEVNNAVRSGVYVDAARSAGVDLASLGDRIIVGPGFGLGVYSAEAIDTDARRATRLSQAICDLFVQRIREQRSDARNNEVRSIRERIASIESDARRIEAIPASRRTAADARVLGAFRAALDGNQFSLATTLSLPPDDIGVIGPAVAERRDPRKLTRNLLIALVGGLLACFLYVLIGEIVAERRRDGASMRGGFLGDRPGARRGDGIGQGDARRAPQHEFHD